MFKAAIKILLISVLLLPLPVAAQNQTVWYVAMTGSNSTGAGSIEDPFQTIQHAIEAASDGDTVIVLEGRYAGPGNVNLSFMGKAIMVRSQDPEDDACVCATIIDAEGQGVIVRFVNDEGPKSVFAGFTLVAGDASMAVQGVPGFFEFSDNARPTTGRLRIAGDGPYPTEDQISLAEAGPPYGGRAWDGNNPFHQPAATTDYHGSGDVNGDGTLTPADTLLAQEMADGLTAPSPKADADGNGVVNTDDVSLINSALAGSVLPGWWNSLAGRTERNAWVSKIVAIDQTDTHPYRYWFKCYSFAVQTFIHGAFYRGDLYDTDYNGGPTVFNVPMYHVSVTGPSYGHSINAILVSDAPLNFDDWRFLEPQADYDVHPGMWDMPYGTNVRIDVPYMLVAGGGNHSLKVVFYVDETGWTLQEYSPDLVLTRPTSVVETPDNRSDLWNPRIVPAGSGMILFERTREDMSRITDIHLADLPFVDPPVDAPLVMDLQYSRLLDISQGPDGTIHLLWKGKPTYNPGVFHSQLDPVAGTITDVTRVSSESVRVRMGRVIVTPSGEIHVFWLQTHPDHRGIYWSRWTGSGWQTEQNLTPEMEDIWEWPSWGNRDFLRYFFDVNVSGDGDVILVWAEPIGSSNDAIVRQLRYDDQWEASTVIDTTNARGVELLADSAGTLHLVYWLGEKQTSSSEGRGSLVHRMYTESSWSASVTVDSSGDTCCPRMAAGTGGEVYMAWGKKRRGARYPCLEQVCERHVG